MQMNAHKLITLLKEELLWSLMKNAWHKVDYFITDVSEN